ncbi:hypothetical protein [uncultured Flavobacterium sp.]|uniref:hypothetical protein n=1 Tax=uncultured Flavobacterium sp. TaxID=165435 RepID=UPI00292E3694|nr:hypothetical protein [uncultured Flavobacterium sp.]
MDTLKCFSLICLCFLVTSCNEYFNEDYSFQGIYLKKWKSSICPKKVILEKYVKKSNFKELIDSSSDFDINSNCLPKYDKNNRQVKTSTYNEQLYISPYIIYKGKINYDIRLIIDDSLEYKITNIESKRDTTLYVFTLGRKYYIDNSIYKMTVNGNKLKNESATLEIPTEFGRIIKKSKK